MAVSKNDLIVGPVVLASGVTVISLDFFFQKAAWLDVYKSGSEVPLILGADYTVAGDGTDTGSVTLSTAANGTDSYSVYLSVPLERSSDMQLRGEFKSGPFNLEMDRLWQAMQGIKTTVSRTLSMKRSTTAAAPIVPDPETGKALAWGVGGNLVNAPITVGDIATDLAASAAARAGAEVAMVGAAASEVSAQRWADLGEDTEVAPSKFSARHHSEKSAGQRLLAEQAAVSAVAARDAAVLGAAGYYADTAGGIAATSDGQGFSIPSGDALGSIDLYLNVASAAVYKGTYPSKDYVEAVEKHKNEILADNAKNGQVLFDGSGPMHPIVVGGNREIILGWDASLKRVVGLGLLSANDPLTQAAGRGLVQYTGSSATIIPTVIGNSGAIIEGVDAVTGTKVALGVSTIGPADVVSDGALPRQLHVDLTGLSGLYSSGQSLSVGAKSEPVLSVAAHFPNNLTYQGGPRAYDGSSFSFAPLKPLVEDANDAPDGGTNRGETPCSGAAYMASAVGAVSGFSPSSYPIFASAGGRGNSVTDDIDEESAWWSVFQNHVSEVYALRPDYALHAVLMSIGESAVNNGVSFSDYRANLVKLQASMEKYTKSVTGQKGPVFFITYQMSSKTVTSPDIARAQRDLARSNDRFYLSTPTYRLPHNSDGVHLTNVGSRLLGEYGGRVYGDLVFNRKAPKFLDAKSATHRGSEIRVRMSVPVLPLILDTANLAATTDHGFKVTVAGVGAAISSITIDGEDVVLTLASPPSGEVEVRYAEDYKGAGLNLISGASGNLRDSDPTMSSSIGGASYQMFNAAVSFRLISTDLGA